VIAIVGDVTAPTFAKVEKYFGALPRARCRRADLARLAFAGGRWA
jgi:hypothetical protein